MISIDWLKPRLRAFLAWSGTGISVSGRCVPGYPGSFVTRSSERTRPIARLPWFLNRFIIWSTGQTYSKIALVREKDGGLVRQGPQIEPAPVGKGKAQTLQPLISQGRSDSHSMHKSIGRPDGLSHKRHLPGSQLISIALRLRRLDIVWNQILAQTWVRYCPLAGVVGFSAVAQGNAFEARRPGCDNLAGEIRGIHFERLYPANQSNQVGVLLSLDCLHYLDFSFLLSPFSFLLSPFSVISFLPRMIKRTKVG